MKLGKYPPKRKEDDKIDFNKSWSVYWSDLNPTPTLCLIQGSSKNTMDIILNDVNIFEVKINDNIVMEASLKQNVRSIDDICIVMNNISDTLVNEGIIRGRLGGEMFDEPDCISDIHFLSFAKRVLDILN